MAKACAGRPLEAWEQIKTTVELEQGGGHRDSKVALTRELRQPIEQQTQSRSKVRGIGGISFWNKSVNTNDIKYSRLIKCSKTMGKTF